MTVWAYKIGEDVPPNTADGREAARENKTAEAVPTSGAEETRTLKHGSERPVALITGTSSGFGMLTAITLAKQGYLAAATMRDLSRKGELVNRAEEAGVTDGLHYLQLDVTGFGVYTDRGRHGDTAIWTH